MHFQSKSAPCLLLSLLILSCAARADGGPAGDPKAGKAIYENSCLLCHGPTGRGDGPAAIAFNPRPMNFQDASKMSKVTEETRVKAVTEGGAAVGVSAVMPSFKDTLSAQQIRDVVAYVRATFTH